MVKVQLQASEKQARREASDTLQDLHDEMMNLAPSEIESRIDQLDLNQIKTLLAIVVLHMRDLEKRVAALEKQRTR